MKSVDRIWLLGLLFILHFGCGGKPGLEYRGGSLQGKNGVVFSARMEADSKSGRLTLVGTIDNRSGGTVAVAAMRAGLRSAGGYWNIPVNTEEGSFTVSASRSRSFTLEYKPVNDPQLHQRIRFRGDLSRTYSLNLGFLTDIDGNLLFAKEFILQVDGERYQKYLGRFGKRPRIFALQLKNKEAFIKAHLGYFRGLPGKKHVRGHHAIPSASMIISGDEFLVRSVILKMVPYFMRNRLFIHLKVINRSDGLSVDLSGMRVSAGGKEYRPLNGFFPGLSRDRKKPGKVKIKLQRNGRLYFDIDYGVVPPVQQLRLNIPGLLDDNKKRIFILPLRYGRAEMQ